MHDGLACHWSCSLGTQRLIQTRDARDPRPPMGAGNRAEAFHSSSAGHRR
ncbi:hypothetical protein D187_007828 [Cystobacter fuscus DSM 2262]|uniref:Uncharacterized protein n=1 Tax=Cystobacter fuscus (strain ATCC 25194 / DSM 2262 / NBRC 100088 / M29) TaxID=1242864 RepID=S9P038_CYSF2|nr:hypothetical protein D187_007828 [Cystobacter fuscus DSM 2262]